MLWLLGNTTVRSPFRLRDGLIALHSSVLQGNLRGREQELEFCKLLSDSGLVSLTGDATYSVGRKWRSALSKLGFLYPKLSSDLSDRQDELGQADAITENGLRLIKTDIVTGWQECFLRSLAAYYIPSVSEPRFTCSVFSPLRYVLSIMKELEKNVGDSKLNFIEMCVFVQLTSPEDVVSSIVNNILEYRSDRDKAVNKRAFDNSALDSLATKLSKVSGTFKDYADTNLRYLKATGLVQSKGKGISLAPEKRVLIEKLILDEKFPENDLAYLTRLCSGAILPTDEKTGAIEVLNDLIAQLNARGGSFDLTDRKTDTAADVAVVRHEIEDYLFKLNEKEYAANQVRSVGEITEYIDLLVTNKFHKTLDSGDEISIPKSEAPAYFEWIIWRAFLAINSLVNEPWDARRFKIDQDFLPVNTAPGGGPDMIFEFTDKILVVEVTLTTSSRQEAAEGEPVRRHVAKYVEEHMVTGKQVLGLFLAVSIDTNTANTFRMGEWYLKDDNKIDVNIIPLSLIDFNNMLIASKNDIRSLLPSFFSFLDNCRSNITDDAPGWKNKIAELSSAVVYDVKSRH